MKKLIAIGILIAMFLLGVLATRAQSTEVNDYSPVFTYHGAIYAVDRTSIEYLFKDRVVFWSVFLKNSDVIFMSMEVNCTLGKARVRSFKVLSSEGTFDIKQTGKWFPKTDELANRYVFVACN